MIKLSTPALAILATLLTPLTAFAQTSEFSLEKKPVWEVGLGYGYIDSVDYPGSKDPNIAQLGLPFFIYRSPILRVGDGGVGAVAVEEPRLQLDVSLGGALNAESEPGSVREGFPDLDLLIELGPRLQYKLVDRQWDNGTSSEITWDSEFRAVLATDFKGIRAQGFVIGSGLAFRQRAIAGDKIDFILNADISFADQRYNDYLYSVPTEFVTDQRERYEAKAGYVESRLFLGLAIRPIESLRIFTGVAAFNYANSANRNSPLFETNTSTQYAVGIVWSAFRSERTIDVYKSN